MLSHRRRRLAANGIAEPETAAASVRPLARAVALAAIVLGLTNCSSTEARDVPAAECDSGTKWVGDETASPRMHPGVNCARCHESSDGLSLALTGTVFGRPGEANDCFGVGGAAVEITDADGRTFALTTNEAGNFFTTRSVAVPYRAKVRFAGRERVMQAPQTDGACNACHTAEGADGAPGRILAP